MIIPTMTSSTSNVQEIDDEDEDLQPTYWDRSSFRRKNVRRKSHVKLRESSILKRYNDVPQEANILEPRFEERTHQDQVVLEDTEYKSYGINSMSQSLRVPEVFVEDQFSPSFKKRTLGGVQFHDEVSEASISILSAHELVEDQVFESSYGIDDNDAFTSEYLDCSKRVIKPSSSLADLLNFSSGSSLGSSSSANSNIGSISDDKTPELSLEEIAEVKSSDDENRDFHLQDLTPRPKRNSHGCMFIGWNVVFFNYEHTPVGNSLRPRS